MVWHDMEFDGHSQGKGKRAKDSLQFVGMA